MQIVVSCICQTGGMAAALKELFPEADVVALPLPVVFPQGGEAEEFVGALSAADVWVSSDHWHVPEEYGLLEKKGEFRLVRIPPLSFPAFHPDICYVKRRSDDATTTHPYNSAICVWCFRHDVPVQHALRLFNETSYRGLGYLDRWTSSVADLKAVFGATDLKDEFERFLLRVKRSGVFMHTVNHPRSQALVELAKIIAFRIGEDEGVFDRDITISDGLVYDVWPVYPEIADSLAVPSSGYRWRMSDGIRLTSIVEYLEFAYDSYARQGLRPDDMYIYGYDNPMLDAVLGAQLGC